MRLLGVSGSLRKASLNTAALEAAAGLATSGITFEMFRDLRDLPLYNYDDDGDRPPPAVRALRGRIAAVDGLVIASPEYAHGISGPMKNALDWLVGDIDFPGKPVALWNTSPRAIQAQAHLREVLTTMSAWIVEAASLALPLLGTDATSDSIMDSAVMSSRISTALEVFERAVRSRKL